MSVTHSVHCEDCDVDALDLGDMGWTGFPSLSIDLRKKADVPQNSGYIYQGFLAVGLLTQELDEFLTYLGDHVGHWLMILEAQGLEYHVAKFEAACGRCDEKISSEHADTVRRGGPHTVSGTAIDEYHHRVIERLDNNFYRSEPLTPLTWSASAPFFEGTRPTIRRWHSFPRRSGAFLCAVEQRDADDRALQGSARARS